MEHKESLIEHKQLGFDNDKYIDLQSKQILNRMSEFSGRLYLEIGGHFSKDHHATRVLPGFKLDTKRQIFQKLKDKCEILYCVNAERLISIKQYSYEEDSYLDQIKNEVILIEKFMGQKPHIVINKIDITNMFDKVLDFEHGYQRKGYKVRERYQINGYPNNPERIFSPEGFGIDDHIPLNKNLVLVVGVESNSGKLSTCLGQIMMDANIGLQSGFAKYETFPVWNLPLEHPVNLAYEAATANIGDINMIDELHQKHYKVQAVNYNRDMQGFSLLKYIGRNIVNHKNHINNYKSPTDMGINTVGFCITDDKVVSLAALEEIRNRKKRYQLSIADAPELKDAVEKTIQLEVQGESFCKEKGYL